MNRIPPTGDRLAPGFEDENKASIEVDPVFEVVKRRDSGRAT